MRIRTTGAERLSRKLRKFAIDAPQYAAQAAVEAAYQEVIPEIHDALEKGNHIWTRKLKESVRAVALQLGSGGKTQKYISLQIDYSGLPYAEKFEKGGKHGDYPMARLRSWVAAKNNLDPQEAAKVARKIQRKLYRDGAKSYPILETVWERTKDRWFTQYSLKMRALMAQLGV
jgi:hypothetical protein